MKLFSRTVALMAASLLTFGPAWAQQDSETPLSIKQGVECSAHPVDSGAVQFMKCEGNLVPIYGRVHDFKAGKAFVCNLAAFPSGYLPTFVQERAESCKAKMSS